MLAFLTSRIGVDLILLVLVIAIIGGGVLYVHTTTATIRNLRDDVATLNIRATTLQAANEDMARDIATIQRVQQATNKSLEATRLQAAQAAQSIQQRKFTGSPQLLQTQINQDTAATFARLQVLSHAP